MWNITKIISKGDYNYAVVKEHPNATNSGYVLEHRIIMENHIGRLLIADEVVHHINENKKDNRIENLKIITKSNHSKMHGLQQGKMWGEAICPQCKKTFILPKTHTFYVKKEGEYNCCSRSCRGKFSRSIQLYGKTEDDLLAISNNIVKEFLILPKPMRS